MHPALQRCLMNPLPAALWLALGGSGLALAGAFVSQYGFGLHPCNLCYWQRVPYALTILLAGFGLWRKRHVSLLVALILLLLLGETGLAAYHAGMEWSWWGSASGCSGAGAAGLTPEELLQRIMNAPAVSCSDAAFRVFGLSMAGWNALYASGMAAGTGYLLLRSRSKTA